MNRLVPLAALILCALPARAETMQKWVSDAPHAKVRFTPWQAGSNTTNEGLRLAQGVYGTLDLSRLPTAEFPLRVRLLHTPAQQYMPSDVVFNGQGRYAMPEPSAPALAPRYTEETTINSPADGIALPVWPAPFIFRLPTPPEPESQMESVRLEIVGHSGTILARQLIGASTWNQMQRRAVVVSAPEIKYALYEEASLDAVVVPGLFPDAFALTNVEVAWIDSTATQDPALTDAYWRRVLLGGTSIAGRPEDIAVLTARLGLSPGESVLNGRLLSCETSNDLVAKLKWPDQRLGPVPVASRDNPFYFPAMVGPTMNVDLVRFSRWYLGIFLVLQVALIIIAFTQVRGERRVWLWLGVPLFALLYALAGAGLAHLFIFDRAEAVIDQVERQREGWPEAQVITNFAHLSLNDEGTSTRFPADSRPAYQIGNSNDPGADWTFRRDASGAQLETTPVPGRREQQLVHSWIPAQAPMMLTPDGKAILALRKFSGAWMWNGSAWSNLGPLEPGTPVPTETLAMAVPAGRTWVSAGGFPAALGWILGPVTTDALTASGDSIFLGVEDAADCTLDDAASCLMKSRRVVAYQFHLPRQP